jgi:hypothetical protein
LVAILLASPDDKAGLQETAEPGSGQELGELGYAQYGDK